MRFLKSPIWQFVGVIIAIITIYITYSIYQDQKLNKKINIEILSNNPLITVNADITSDISILYKNKQVNTMSIILLKFTNAGNVPIIEQDYSEPISIELSKNSEIGEVSVQETNPAGIKIAATIISPNTLEISKVLLNPGDQFIIKILAINNDETLNINARIIGINKLNVISTINNQSNTDNSSSIALFIICGLSILIFVIPIILNMDSVIRWRIEHFGYDPAKDHYLKAEEYLMGTGSLSSKVQHASSELNIALGWNIDYLDNVIGSEVFQEYKKYEQLGLVIQKYLAIKNKMEAIKPIKKGIKRSLNKSKKN